MHQRAAARDDADCGDTAVVDAPPRQMRNVFQEELAYLLKQYEQPDSSGQSQTATYARPPFSENHVYTGLLG